MVRRLQDDASQEAGAMTGRTFLSVFLTWMAFTPLQAGSLMELHVTPTVSFAPADVVVNAVIEADAANRAIRVTAESADFYRSSEMQLQGDEAPRTTEFDFHGLPTGQYVVTATLLGANGKVRASLHQTVNVTSGGF
jgi:hypothetical protein